MKDGLYKYIIFISTEHLQISVEIVVKIIKEWTNLSHQPQQLNTLGLRDTGKLRMIHGQYILK